jgi:hypothetical protein
MKFIYVFLDTVDYTTAYREDKSQDEAQFKN